MRFPYHGHGSPRSPRRVGLWAARTARAGRPLGGTPVALVTADSESSSPSSLATGRRLREIATLPGPRSTESVWGAALVAHTEEGAVSILDGARLRVRRVLGGFEEPRYTAASASGRYAFVSDSSAQEVAVLDVVRGHVARGRRRAGAPHLAAARRAPALGLAGLQGPRDRSGGRPRAVLPRLALPASPWSRSTSLRPRLVWVSSGDRRELALYRARPRVSCDASGQAHPRST